MIHTPPALYRVVARQIRGRLFIAQREHLTRRYSEGGETPETAKTLDEQQKNETNPISRNPFAINGLRLVFRTGRRTEVQVGTA